MKTITTMQLADICKVNGYTMNRWIDSGRVLTDETGKNVKVGDAFCMLNQHGLTEQARILSILADAANKYYPKKYGE